jgi:hypothetical protein
MGPRREHLPVKVDRAFYRLGDQQRGKPERAMELVTHFHPGVLSVLVEAVGDIQDRMQTCGPAAGYPCMKKKINDPLRWLDQGWWGPTFEIEHDRNLANNREHRKLSIDDYNDKLTELLLNYAEEHAKLPVYNEAQLHAREAAVALGLQDWDAAVEHLEELNRHLGSAAEWVEYAHQYELDSKGNPKLYV